MTLDTRRLVDGFLAASDEPCLGAAFCSYTFDPVYFEEQVLRAILRLAGDPEEDGARFHEEARAALREIPVACLIDASVRRGGRRLPYDLHLIRGRTFHPKIALVLYESEARLAVGSGNLTRSGFEDNAELYFTRALRYDDPVDAAMLRAVDAFLGACVGLSTERGIQLDQVREELGRRVAGTAAPSATAAIDAVFVHSFERPGLRWLADALPPEARITRVGVLAPYFERDDLGAGDEQDGVHAILAELLALRPGSTPALDLGVPWDDAPLTPPTSAADPTLEAGPALWALRDPVEKGQELHGIGYCVVRSATAKRVELEYGDGTVKRWPREVVEAAIAERRFWPVATPTVHAPATIIRRLAVEHPLDLWLHPTSTLTLAGRPLNRSLHAKLLLVTATHGRKTSTFALVGSANASRAALGRTVAHGGNVEAGVVLRLDDETRLHDLVPGLVRVPLEQVALAERDAPQSTFDLSAWITLAIHHADARTLTIEWATAAPQPLGAWRLRYQERTLATGDGPGTAPLVVPDFDLAASCAEVELAASGETWMIPIQVADPALLPARVGQMDLDLRAMLAVLGRRVGSERLATVRETRGREGVSAVLEALFGEGFGPTDVWKAWWELRDDLSTAPTMAAFRNRLEGLTGVTRVWQELSLVSETELSSDERWIYGCELCRELAKVEHPARPDREARQAMLDVVVASIRDDLRSLEPPDSDRPWLVAVRRFYDMPEES